MFFTQSRIGMNDVYVGLFIVAAYTVFAAVWTGWWRGRGAFWIAMPVIGLLLGLALASKWVAAYAIGALVLLLLVRSALGRVVAILGLIGITSVLGYMAISVPEGQGVGNLPFLAIMVGLTLVAVVVAISHPIAWTDEEMWLAVGAPARRRRRSVLRRPDPSASSTPPHAIGPLAVTPLLASIALALAALGRGRGAFHVGAAGWATGRWPPPPGPDDPGPPPAAARRRRRTAGCGRASARRPAARVGRGLPRDHPARRVRRQLHPVGAHREPPAVDGRSRPATPARPSST